MAAMRRVEVRSLEELKQLFASYAPGTVAVAFPADGSLGAAKDIGRFLDWGADGDGFLLLDPEIVQSKAEIFQFAVKRVEKLADWQRNVSKRIATLKGMISSLRHMVGLDGESPKKSKMGRGTPRGGSSHAIVEFSPAEDGKPCYVRHPSALGKRGMMDRSPFQPPDKRNKLIGSPHKTNIEAKSGSPHVSPVKIKPRSGSSHGMSPVKIKPKSGLKSEEEMARDDAAQNAFYLFNLQFLQVRLKLLEEQEHAVGKAYQELTELLSAGTEMGTGRTVLDFLDLTN